MTKPDDSSFYAFSALTFGDFPWHHRCALSAHFAQFRKSLSRTSKTTLFPTPPYSRCNLSLFGVKIPFLVLKFQLTTLCEFTKLGEFQIPVTEWFPWILSCRRVISYLVTLVPFVGLVGVTRRVPSRQIGPVVGARCSSVYHLRYELLARRCVTKVLSNV